jgi:hypothetical protein
VSARGEKYRVFGIRHHGPGSARSLLAALDDYAPDAVLIEGPPEGDALLPLAAHADMRPPVALLLYALDEPNRAAFYPFAEFSPEWQALRYAQARNLPVRFFDLPQSHSLAPKPPFDEPEPPLEEPAGNADEDKNPLSPGRAERGGRSRRERGETKDFTPLNTSPSDRSEDFEGGKTHFDLPHPHPLPEGEGERNSPSVSAEEALAPIAARSGEDTDPEVDAETCSTIGHPDPWWQLARLAGFADPEALWNRLVEERPDTPELFIAIAELMRAIRDDDRVPRRDWVREAWMRRELRAELKAGRERIALVCGAFHAPALLDLPPAKQDQELLRDLPKTRVGATWVPWTYGRLARASGYGAGVESPGWYEHLWRKHPAGAAAWMSRAAAVFREHDLDIAPAHAIEATRLAETLAALRGRAEPGLAEVTEAIQTIYCHGETTPLRLVEEKLSVGERLGAVPAETPEPPLAADLRREQKRLRLSPEASERLLDLDLRKDNDLARSHLLHRLAILGVPWGRLQEGGRSGLGTFHEHWRLRWDPELAVNLIEAGRYGNRIADAAETALHERAADCGRLPELAAMLEAALKAGLPAAVPSLAARLDAAAALSDDIGDLMRAYARLAPVAKYGDVRRTDTGALRMTLRHYLERICIGLSLAASGIQDEAAAELLGSLVGVDQAVHTLDEAEALAGWQDALAHLADHPGAHPLLLGRATRLLLDRRRLTTEEAARRLGLALSPGVAAQQAAWLEGFLAESGLLLIHQPELLGLLDAWVCGLRGEVFDNILPLLRRAFAKFPKPERKQIGQKLAAERGHGVSGVESAGKIDWARGRLVLPTVALLFGVEEVG